jgi:hypothetical protein
MIRTISSEELVNLFQPKADVLRDYSVRVHVVTSVDNQGEACGFCGYVDNRVAVNIYGVTLDDGDVCADCCLNCIAYVLDAQSAPQFEALFPVVIELAQGAA